jgi:site-specific recombinase XerD
MKLYDASKQFMEWRKRQNLAAPTYIQNGSNLRQFSIYMHNCDLENVTENEVLDYIGLLEDQMEIKNNSLIPKINALRQFFKYWNEREEHILNYKLIPLRKKEFIFPKICTKEDYAKFWAAISAPSNHSQRIRNTAMVAVMAATGIRNGEAASMRMDKTDFLKPIAVSEGNIMYRAVIKTEKTRGMKPFREIFWNEDVNEYVKRWVERRDRLHQNHTFTNPELLFVGLNSKNSRSGGWGRQLTPNSIDEIFRRYSRMSGVDINPHMLRHMMGRDMAENDASEHVISDVLGHSRLDSSRIYTHLYGKAVGQQFWRFRGIKESAKVKSAN